MENLEKQIVRIIENNSPELAAEEILRLLGVVGQSEQLKTFCEECSEPVEEKKQIIICQDCWDVKQSF